MNGMNNFNVLKGRQHDSDRRCNGLLGQADLTAERLRTISISSCLLSCRITMSIMARENRGSEKGYATDFVSAIVASHLQAIADSGVKLSAMRAGSILRPVATRSDD